MKGKKRNNQGSSSSFYDASDNTSLLYAVTSGLTTVFPRVSRFRVPSIEYRDNPLTQSPIFHHFKTDRVSSFRDSIPFRLGIRFRFSLDPFSHLSPHQDFRFRFNLAEGSELDLAQDLAQDLDLDSVLDLDMKMELELVDGGS